MLSHFPSEVNEDLVAVRGYLLLLALYLIKIVVRAFPTALRHATACTMVLFFIASASFSPGVIWMCPLGQQQREKGERHTGSLTVSC